MFEIISFNVFPSSLQDIYGSEQVYNALLLKLYKKGKTNSSEQAKYDFGCFQCSELKCFVVIQLYGLSKWNYLTVG